MFMKCPKCGYEWTEGHLYCDNCGEEFRIVPDFEPEIEKEMNETLSTLLVELAQEEMPKLEEAGKDNKKERKQPASWEKEGWETDGWQPPSCSVCLQRRQELEAFTGIGIIRCLIR